MSHKFLKSFVALALIASSAPALAQSYDDTTNSEAQAPEGAGLWIGVLMTLVVLGVIIWHDKLFSGDDDDAPVSP